jgi:hypothetical protein
MWYKKMQILLALEATVLRKDHRLVGNMISRWHAVEAKNKTIYFYRRPIAEAILAVAKMQHQVVS